MIYVSGQWSETDSGGQAGVDRAKWGEQAGETSDVTVH